MHIAHTYKFLPDNVDKKINKLDKRMTTE